MSWHPDHAALEAYVLGHHDEIDPPAIERHLEGCDRCLDEVGREARLELLLDAAGREDAFAAVVPLRPRRRWPVVAAAAAVAVAAAAAVAFAIWRPGSPEGDALTASSPAPRHQEGAPAAPPTGDRPAWVRGLGTGSARCEEVDGGLTCVAASGYRRTRDEGAAQAGDLARVALLEQALSRGGPTIAAQRAVYARRRFVMSVSPSDKYARIRQQIAERSPLGRRDTWYWEEYNREDGDGTEFLVYVRFRADQKEIDAFLAGYRGASVDRAQLVPALPTVCWVVDPGDRLAFFVYRPGKLADLGIRSRDVLLMDHRRNASAMRALIESDQVLVWRVGLEAPVPPSKLP